MATAFQSLKGRIGIIVPFSRYIGMYYKLFSDMVKPKLNADDRDIMIGTPDMFRGIQRDLIIVSSLRNSVIDGLGYFNDADFINLAASRASQFFWVVGSSTTLVNSP
jgi:superfamily I DNA and/or RNA helicase